MTQREILQEIKRLTLADQLNIMEALLKSLREQMQISALATTRVANDKLPLAEAAALLKSDYESDRELLAFTVLDAEDFHA